MGFIYKLTLKKESRKAYIGQTIRDIEERLKEHQLPSSGCRAIYNAIKKHGWENFDKEWYEIPDEDLNFYEEMLVALLGTLSPGGYNLKEGGGSTGKPSEETKQKISEANIGKTCTEETKQKMSKAKSGKKHYMYGKEHTEETKKKMKEAHTGNTRTEETKKKISDATSGEKNHNSKKMYQYTLDGTYVDSYGSCGDAARALGKSSGPCISKCARGDRRSAYGFKWSYTEL
ncbi:hypothetical protein FR483_N380R [Paramecium bursaria Chlorella virus FR483]|uniref:Uncharacterized protein N380R n=1 Tax=Paramecium bursaria Chlorella virus FR483 TaxID=399781 RepID=A7J784_PBCVF|nr:hypothetical protein FR483_N380R [Paramecium bursaria Chlorella virus FR483]ABT15665.1 hypothetical protein FR483_N380R [Paramecium bursaria Chlorella virus FR483]